MSVKRRLGFRLAVSVLALLIALAAVEIGARLIFRVQHHRLAVAAFPWIELRPAGPRLAPATHRDIFARINGRTIRLDVNALGFRGPELLPRAPGRPRIAILGDSIVFGPGLEEKETIPGRLRRLLPGAEIVNAAVPGLGTREEVDLLVETYPRVLPDAVVLGFYLNDSRRSIVLEEEYGDLPDFITSAVTRLRESSVAMNELWPRLIAAGLIRTGKLSTDWALPFNRRGWIEDRADYRRVIELAADDFGAAWREDSWPPVEREFKRLADFCAAHGMKAAVVVFPVYLQVKSEAADSYPQERVRAIAEKLGLPVLDLLPALRARRDGKLFYDQCHLTALGADIAALELARFLRENRLAP